MSKNRPNFRILRERIENILNEHFTRDKALNAEIERRLLTLQPPMKHYVADAVEVLYMAGTKGFTINEWREAIKEIYKNTPEAIPNEMVSNILATTNKTFPEHIFNNKRTGIVKWYDIALPKNDRETMVQSIELASECLKVITDADEPITLEDWANAVAANLRYPIDMVKGYIEVHVLPHMGSAISKTADGKYSIQKDTPQGYQEIFNRLLDTNNRLPGVEDQE